MSKPSVITSFGKLPKDIQEQIKLEYPRGFEKFLIRFKNHKKKFVSALPYETEEKNYMVKMSIEEAQRIILADDDYNESGILKLKIQESYQAKFADEDDDEDEDDGLGDIDDLNVDDIPAEEDED